MTTAIPNEIDLAAALVANADALPENAALLAGLVVDEARRTNAAGTPRSMLEHVDDARRLFPHWFNSPKSTTAASASIAPRSLTERIAQGETPSFDEVSDAIRRMRKANQG